MIYDTATIMSKGQINLPLDICKKMKLTAGTRVALVCQNDRIVMMNPAIYAMEKLQEEMAGEWEKAGVYSEDDILEFCREMRVMS